MTIASLSFPRMLAFLSIACLTANSLQVVTTTTVRGTSPAEMHPFLATPTNWPKIVASSQSVRPSPGRENRVDAPLRVGDAVEEVFGLPPILPLAVCWTCERSDISKGDLAFFSADGLKNVANNCRMIFEIEDGKDEALGKSCKVKLTMEYEPLSPLVVLATPVVTLDNALALKFLLPRSV